MRPAAAVALALLAAAPFAGCFEPASNGWASSATEIDDLRSAGSDGRGVRVAILDTGLAAGHPSLRHLRDGDAFNGELLEYVDFLGNAGGPRDRSGHGTFVAGVLAGRPPEGLGSMTSSGSSVLGLAPGVDLLVGRACEQAHCSPAALMQALRWAVASDADVISLSVGYTEGELADRGFVVERIQQVLREAEEKGILVVAAAGNEGTIRFPASEPTVLAVGASDRHGGPWTTSARGLGSKPDLVAPGEDIVGPGREGGRVTRDGTSAAVPFVVAAASLMMSSAGKPDTAEEIAALRDALRDSAQPLPGQRLPHDLLSGNGLLQASKALTMYERSLAALDDVATAWSPPEREAAKTPSPINGLPVAAAWSSTTS